MLNSPSIIHTASEFEIRFQSLFREGRALAFPCDSRGLVDLDAMGEAARKDSGSVVHGVIVLSVWNDKVWAHGS